MTNRCQSFWLYNKLNIKRRIYILGALGDVKQTIRTPMVITMLVNIANPKIKQECHRCVGIIGDDITLPVLLEKRAELSRCGSDFKVSLGQIEENSTGNVRWIDMIVLSAEAIEIYGRNSKHSEKNPLIRESYNTSLIMKTILIVTISAKALPVPPAVS